MKFTAAALFSAVLCADAALGARREGLVRKSQTKRISPGVSTNVTKFVEYDDNWAGAVLVSTGFTSVTGTVTVPRVSGADDAAGAAWVGIDGDTCDTILQTGIDWYGDGTYDAWYEWYPDDSFNFDIDIAEGDSIKMTVTATSKSGGSAVIDNLTTGQTVTKTFSRESPGLCEVNAEWIVEDFSECDSNNNCQDVPFANFGTVEFTGCSAVKSGSTVTPSGADILDIRQNSILTSCSSSGSTVTCKYV